MSPEKFDKVETAIWETTIGIMAKLDSTELFEFCAGILGAATILAIRSKNGEDAITSLETLRARFVPSLIKDVQTAMEREMK